MLNRVYFYLYIYMLVRILFLVSKYLFLFRSICIKKKIRNTNSFRTFKVQWKLCGGALHFLSKSFLGFFFTLTVINKSIGREKRREVFSRTKTQMPFYIWSCIFGWGRTEARLNLNRCVQLLLNFFAHGNQLRMGKNVTNAVGYFSLSVYIWFRLFKYFLCHFNF